MNRNWRTWAFTGLVSVIGGLLPAAFSPASAQDIVPQENRGVPQDWSHRNAIVRNAETMKEASGKGVVAFERWKQKLKDPRYTMAVAKKTIDVQPTANKIFSGQQLAYAQKGKQNPPLSTLKRDWNVALGNATAVDNAGTGTGVGTEGMFPAKFTWDINATPSCANDFIVYSTMTPGATSGTSARQTVSFGGSGGPPDWTALNSGAGTLTIQNGAGGPSIVLVAQNAASPTANEGLNFYVGNSGSSNSRAFWAYNLAAAINRNGVTVGVSATSSDGVVTIVANAVGLAGNGITLASTAALNTQLFMTLGGTNLAGGAERWRAAHPGGLQPVVQDDLPSHPDQRRFAQHPLAGQHRDRRHRRNLARVCRWTEARWRLSSAPRAVHVDSSTSALARPDGRARAAEVGSHRAHHVGARPWRQTRRPTGPAPLRACSNLRWGPTTRIHRPMSIMRTTASMWVTPTDGCTGSTTFSTARRLLPQAGRSP
jgi:hypothetical protein